MLSREGTDSQFILKDEKMGLMFKTGRNYETGFNLNPIEMV